LTHYYTRVKRSKLLHPRTSSEPMNTREYCKGTAK
jgi:hypothetical protein